ncbi:G5 domain-containing protein [Streptococcus uberis]|uniref:G5 domain-containing protein n=1 Tax=Streptococcus uberis TaxID=1349 RepID=UPI0027DC9E37|nr:G5 domain-containing protein [Streptococcus uberis]MCK1233365.1 G5 domain-containing protein [Streptococcus uberis]
MFKTKKEIFSIRKTALGVGSVLLGVMLTTQVASADEVSLMTPSVDKSLTTTSPVLESTSSQLAATTAPTTTDTTSNVTATSPVLAAATTAPSVTTTPIASPIRYVSDPNQPVGYRATQVQGTDGSIITTQTGALDVNGNPIVTVERIEPTETVIVLGTKSTSQVTGTQAATTTYSIDVTKPVGTDIVIPAVDGQTTTTTTYKIETATTAPVSPSVLSEGYKWIDQPFYHVDTTQTLPSDRISIDQLFVPMPVLTPDYNTTESTVREYAQYAENYMYDYITVTNPDGSTTRQQVIRPVTSEMLDPTNTRLRTLTGLTDDNAFYSRLFDASQQDLWNTSAQDYGLEIVPEDLNTSTDDFLRYHSSNIINDALYADIKADYLRAQLAYDQLVSLGTLTSDQQSAMDMMTSQFESLTLRYNNYKDSVAIDVDYSNTTMSATQQADFEAKLAALPVEVQRAISELTIYDGQIPGMGETTLGLANSADQTIALKYEANNLNLVSTVLHEMTHIIDFKSGLYSETTDRNTDGSLSTVMAFSDTQEFLDVYHTYFDRPDVWSYYSDNSEEAFAEGLSQYIMHRLFGTPYSTYIANPYTGDANNPGDGSGYSPFAETEFYFASLYNRLFEYPRTAQVVPYLLTTTTTAPVNGQVIYGAMAEETTTTTPYTTVYVGDTSFAYDPTGQTDRVQAGVDGTETIRTTYSLDSNNQLVATQTVISSTPVQNQIITKGTQPTVVDTSVPMTIVYQEVTDGSLGDWQVKVLDAGQDGLIRSTTTYSVDPVTGIVTPSTAETTITAMRPMIVQYQVGSEKVTAIPYQTRYVIDTSLATGTQVIVQAGVDGSSTESVQSFNFIQDGSNSHFDAIIYSSPVVVAAQDQVIAVGGQDQVTDQAVAKTIFYQEVTDGSLGDWQVKVLDAGQDGLVRTTTSYSVDPVTGIVTPSTTEATITAMKPMIVQYQVGSPQTSTIPFQTEYVADPNLAYGSEKVVTVGQDGVVTKSVASYDFIQDGVNSRFANITYSEVNNPQVVNEVIAKGTQTVISDKMIARTVTYQEVTDGSLGDWQVKVVQTGQDGLIRTTTTYSLDSVSGIVTPTSSQSTITAMEPMTVQYQAGSPKVTPIAYRTRYVADSSIPVGTQAVIQPGKDGTSTIYVDSYQFIQSGATSHFENIVYSNPVVVGAQDLVIGVGVVNQTHDEIIARTVNYQEITDGSLGDWQVNVLDAGQDGLIRTTTSYTVDSQTGQVSSTRTQNQLTEMLPMTVQYQIGSSKVTAIPYQTRYVIDNSLAAGTQVIVQEGVNGSSTESVQSYNFIQDGSNSRFDAIVYASPVVVAAQDQVIAVGGQDQVSDQIVAKTIVYQEVSDGSLGDWQVKVLDGGQDGLVRTTTSYSVDPVTGLVTPSTTEATITAMRPMIVQYQVGKSKLSAIPFLTEYVTDDSLAAGLEKIIQEGVVGTQIETVQSFHFIQDGANSHFENIAYNSPSILILPQNVIIARGTKADEVVVPEPEVVTPKPETSEVISPEKGQTAPTITVEAIKAPAQKKAKVEAVTTPKESLPTTGDDQNLLVTLMSSLLLMSLGLGLKKKEDE